MERKIWTQKDEDYLRNNINKLSTKEIATHLKRSESSVKHKIQRSNLSELKISTKWSEEEIRFLKNNYKEMTYQELADKLHRTKSAVDLKINRLGLKKSKYTYNSNYFNVIDTPEKAYWLGFIAADGCVSINSKTNSGELTIKLQISDNDHLKKFNKALDGNIPVITGTDICNLNNKSYEYSLIRIYSIQLASSLNKLGVTPDKSKTILFPEINSNLIPHFIRGFFDGDGCITKTHHSNGKDYVRCDFCCASINFIKRLRSILDNNGIKSYIYKEQNKALRLVIGGMINTDKFLKFIYQDASIYLERKFKKKNQLYESLNIEQRLLRQAEKSGSF